MRSLKIFLVTFFSIIILSIAILFGLDFATDGMLSDVIFGDSDEVHTDTNVVQTVVKPEDKVNKIVATGITFLDDVEDIILKHQFETYQEELHAAMEINEDVKAWLRVPGTNISHPIPINTTRKTQSGEIDYNYYLTRRLDGSYAPNYDNESVIYCDSRNNLDSKESMNMNTILYGHNWTNIETGGSPLKVADPKDFMFAQLPSFANYDFACENQFFTLDLDGDQLVFVIFSAMYVDTWQPDNLDGYYYLETDPNTDQLAVILSEARKRSEHIYKVPVNLDDKMICLSTCTTKFGSDPNQRFVIMARALRDNEDLDDFEKPTPNPQPQKPNVSY